MRRRFGDLIWPATQRTGCAFPPAYGKPHSGNMPSKLAARTAIIARGSRLSDCGGISSEEVGSRASTWRRRDSIAAIADSRAFLPTDPVASTRLKPRRIGTFHCRTSDLGRKRSAGFGPSLQGDSSGPVQHRRGHERPASSSQPPCYHIRRKMNAQEHTADRDGPCQ